MTGIQLTQPVFGVLIQYKDVDGLVQDCCISSALALEILQSCTKPLMWSYQYGKSQCGDKTVIRSSYHNDNSDTGNIGSLYWISPKKCDSQY